jgi:glutamine synthetase type III
VPKEFDPSKFLKQAQDTIDAANTRKGVLESKKAGLAEKVEKAKKVQADAAAAKQKAVDEAVTKAAAIDTKIADENALIVRTQAFIDGRSENVVEQPPAQVILPEGHDASGEFGQF